MQNKTISNIDDYISEFSEDTREILNKIRKTIIESAPQASEKLAIEYQNSILIEILCILQHSKIITKIGNFGKTYII